MVVHLKHSISVKSVLNSLLTFCTHIQVAAISGDARRALEICRRAAEIKDYHLKNLNSTTESVSLGTWTFLNFWPSVGDP